MCLAFFVITKKGVVESVQTEIILGSHLAYSLILLKFVFPVLKIHVVLISRNEMGKEWKNHWHYVANATSMGDNIYVHDMDDDEFNDLLDSGSFIYDPARNPFESSKTSPSSRFQNAFTFFRRIVSHCLTLLHSVSLCFRIC
jgi:hypothetical protein